VTLLDRTDRVNVGIYNEQDVLVKTLQVERAALEAMQSVPVTGLTVGSSYTAVCWGNAFAETHIDWKKQLVQHPDLTNESVLIPTDDALTYGRQDFTVHELHNDTTVHFEPAVIHFEIAVMGLSSTAVIDRNEQPYVRISGLETEIYDFWMQDVDDEHRTFYPTWSEQPADGVLTLRTAVHRMANTNNVHVELMDNFVTNRRMTRVELTDYITQYPQYTVNDQKELTIYITINLNPPSTDPQDPQDPQDPTDPVCPVCPTDPTNPTDPTDPTNPTDPTDPTNPTNPTDPTDPTNPTDPTDPTDPTNPTDPTDGDKDTDVTIFPVSWDKVEIKPVI
jgi:hypothetical protein